MKPPILRPSSLPALAKCPCYSPDQHEGEQQKSEGTRRHTALERYLAGDPSWRDNLGEWDADGVEWAGEYIETHAPIEISGVEVEQSREVTLDNLETFRGTPDVVSCDHLFDLKGRDIADYRDQMAGYIALLRPYYIARGIFTATKVHVLYATERRAETFEMDLIQAEAIVNRIADAVADPNRKPALSDYCGWCANRGACPAFAAAGQAGAKAVGLEIPPGPIDEIRDADSLGLLKLAADAVAEWAKMANSHVREMAWKHGVIATGFKLVRRVGNPTITDAWAAIANAGLTPTEVASLLSISLPDLVKAYAEKNGVKEKAAKADLEARLGALIKRGADVLYLTSTR